MEGKLERAYLTNLHIKKVRHLENLEIKLSEQEQPNMKHLLFTGKNGSGKTSVLDSLAAYLDDICGKDQLRQESLTK